MRNRSWKLLPLVMVGFFAFVSLAQDEPQSRSITSDDFAKNRPAGKQGVGRASGGVGRTGRKYAFVKRDRTRVNWKSKQQKHNASAARRTATMSEIGLTIWRLRPPKAGDGAARKLPVVDDNRVRVMWVPERVRATQPFNVGDRVRLAVESPASGYLYVLNSEIYSDSTFGPPHLIFPAPADQPNLIHPGILVDFPDQTEDLPYFRINPRKGNHVGELVILVVSQNKLDFKVDPDGQILNAGDVIDSELEFEADVFDRSDQADKIYTKAEADATCGSKARQLERQSTEPCGAATRQLTREEPTPQSIYRVKSYAGRPAIVFVRLNTAR